MRPSPHAPVHPAERVLLHQGSVPALLLRPDAPGPHPAAVLQHGYGAAKEDLLPLATLLAAQGFVTLLPDAWGHGERLPASGPTWMTELSADFVLEVVRSTTADVSAALGELAARPDVRPDALLLGGFSLGAMVALIVGTEDPRVAGVISVAGSPLPDLANLALLSTRPASAETEAWATAHDAAAHVARLAPKPLLLQHGRHDDMVPVGGTLRLHQAALPAYAAHPERLALMLYEHTHLVTEAQLRDAVEWITPHFLPEATREQSA